MKQRRYLADSTVVIDHLNGIEAATMFLRDHASEIALSVITREVADQAARFRREHRWKLPDAFQVAIARKNKLALATRNVRDFPPERHAFVKVPYQVN